MSPDLREVRHSVWLNGRRVGTIHQRGDYTRFVFLQEYVDDPARPVLGLQFEQRLLRPEASALRVPPWFSNLLPEGRVREWVAEDRDVSVDREMELLAHLGHDLPGAVQVLPADETPDDAHWDFTVSSRTVADGPVSHPGWRISLAGVQLKFAVLAERDRMTIPAFGEGSDWIVKLPDRQFAKLPRNEHAMMSLAAAAGIDVPELKLVHRDLLVGLPPNVWPGGEEWAYAIKRFDRGPDRDLIHIEDLAQVRGFYPHQKYSGNFETVASLIYRRRDMAALREFARRLTFVVLIGNGDAHLKNWSLIYRDPRVPTLSPAYDLVSTAMYRVGEGTEDLGLKFFGSRDFDRVRLSAFRRLQSSLGASDADLPRYVEETVLAVQREWPRIADTLADMPELRASVGEAIAVRSSSLLK